MSHDAASLRAPEPIFAISLFSGYGGLDEGVRAAIPGIRTVAHVELEAYAVASLVAQMEAGALDKAPVFASVTSFDGASFARDLLRVTGRRVRAVIGGFPCFIAGTLILTERGYVPVESVVVGDSVLTHFGRWRRVTSVMARDGAPVRRIRGGGLDVIATDEHPFWARRCDLAWNNADRQYRRRRSAPDWVNAGKLEPGHFTAQVLPGIGNDSRSPEFWWVIGRYLADGWTVARHDRPDGAGRVVLGIGKHKADDVRRRLDAAGIHATESDERTGVKFHICRNDLYQFVQQLGRGASGKCIPGWVLGLDTERAVALLDGYRSGDGYDYGGGWKASTVSRSLALGIALLAQRAYGVVASISHTERPATCVIEGRTVNQRDTYTINVPDRNRSSFVDGAYGWRRIRSVAPAGEARVYNLSVDEDESYVAEGAIVHNCQDISYAGKGAGLDGERSGLWFAMRDIIRDVGPDYVFVENVAAITRRGLDAVLGSLADLRYDAEWGCLAASDVGCSHQRKRLFLVAYSQRAQRGTGLISRDGGGEGLDTEGQEADRPRVSGAPLADAVGVSGERRRDARDMARQAGSPDCEAHERKRRGPAADDRGAGVLGDAVSTRLEVGRGGRGDDGAQLAATERAGLPFAPPRPDAAAGWAAVLARRPWLAPAVIGPVRRVADGAPLGDELCLCPRTSRLRLLGNGVVPAQAAFAFRALLTRLGKHG